jgi:epoxide hydrolase-like predicted phosphatase
VATSSFDALIVDFGGVLTTPLQDAMVQFAEELGIELQDLVRAALGAYTGQRDDLVTRFETGQISEKEFSTAFAQRLGDICGRPIDPDGLVRRIFGGMRLEESMFELVATARAEGKRTALLSNSWGVELYPRERISEIFDVVVISGEVGLRKPDSAIFEFTVENLGVPAQRCVFVDDHPGHLKAAAELGMTTVLHRTPDQTIEEVTALLSDS